MDPRWYLNSGLRPAMLRCMALIFVEISVTSGQFFKSFALQLNVATASPVTMDRRSVVCSLVVADVFTVFKLLLDLMQVVV